MSDSFSEVTFTTKRVPGELLPKGAAKPTSLHLDIVTAITTDDGGTVEFVPTEEAGQPQQLTTTLTAPVARRLLEFCSEKYTGQPTTEVNRFDCHAALTYWMGLSQTVEPGVGTSKFSVEPPPILPSEFEAQPGVPYGVYNSQRRLALGSARAIAETYAGANGSVLRLGIPNA
ncbi:MAG TPA: hypothetical protein VK674_02655 [Candidatus Limnocylindria bacterium]|nr:hypothetical protein [Candidatus Limnocylindria bacterium]